MVAICVALAVGASATAQASRDDVRGQQQQQQQQQTPLVAAGPTTGQVARSSVGEAGRRQTREQAAAGGIEPLARIANRVQNRVQNRLRNRIDRNYDPKAGSPFEVAEDQARTSGRSRR